MKAFLKYFLIGALMTLLGCLIAFYGYYVGFCFSAIGTLDSVWKGIILFLLNIVQTIFLIVFVTAVGSLVMCKKSSKENSHEELS